MVYQAPSMVIQSICTITSGAGLLASILLLSVHFSSKKLNNGILKVYGLIGIS